MPEITSNWWKEYLKEDVNEETFTSEQNTLFETYQATPDQKRIFQSIKTGKNLFLPDDLTNEEILWNIGVMGVRHPHRGDMTFYRKSVIERLKRHDEAERRYKWRTGQWTRRAMRVLVEQWSLGMMVVVPDIETSDGSPMIFTKEWYEHMPLRDDLPEGFWEYRATTVYPLMARSICRCYPMATMKGLVSLADMTDFDWDKYDMEQKMRHSDLQAVIPNKLRRMISINPDEKMKKQLEDFGTVAKKYGFVMYDTLDDAMAAEAKLLPSEIPTWVGGSLRVDIKKCLRYLFRREPEALELMEDVYKEMEEKNEILHPTFMQNSH
eukprot:CAMPEP_0172520164 /NCGR_PEP_ID=MMETSP1066-20121228/291844_1 /TAXON_ID=671091 /ORGANISM="Coscinodiscus wailesii, Strain CCMP2513" /LENGTH=322 /DNA_ID=CAMNT_0013302875 /DNA_START=169 /DNA_END=1140 /DNA_ORIENTATION=-